MYNSSLDSQFSGLDFIRSNASQAILESTNEQKLSGAIVVLGLLVPIFCFHLLRNKEVLPVVNRLFRFEPRAFARFRWAFNSKQILENADRKFNGKPYLLNRGDIDMVVLPPDFVSELNTLSQNVINSRRSHSTTLLGHLNGINVVLETSFHVKLLLNKVTPSLPHFFKPAALRIQETLGHEFPQKTTEWTAVEPLDKVALCISRAMTLMIFDAPTCDNPELIRTFVDHAENVFSVAFVMGSLWPEAFFFSARGLFSATPKKS